MNKKYLPGLVAAIVAICLAVFVAIYVNTNNNHANSAKDSSSQSSKDENKSKTGDTKKDTNKEDSGKDTTSQSTGDTQTGSQSGVPADQRSNGALAVITKPGSPTTPSTPPVTGGIGGGDTSGHPNPVITTQEETVTQEIAFTTEEVNDDTLNQGERVVTQQGVNGSTTTVYTVTYTDGVETNRVVKSVTTVDPVKEVVHVGTRVTTQDCAVLSGTNLVVNGNVESATGDQPTGWTKGGYGEETGTVFNDTYVTPGCDGSGHALQVAITAKGTDGDAKWLSQTFGVTAGTTYQISDWYKSDVNTEMDVLLTGAGVPDLYKWVGDANTSADWANFKGQFDVPAGYTTATVFHVLAAVGTLNTDDYSVVAGASTEPGPGPEQPPANGFAGGLVSLTFDDGLTSTYQHGLPILQKYNFVSTLYLISDTLKNNDEYGGEYMTVADVNAWVNSLPGTELASHTVHHCDLTGRQTDDKVHCPTGLSAADQAALNNQELTQSKADLQELFPGNSFNDFATPYGAYNATVLSEIAAAGYTSHRSTDGGFNAYGAVNPMNIVVQNVENTTTVAQVEGWIDQAKANNTWLVLVYHDVGPVAGQYGVTTADLDAQLGYLSTSGVKVVTVEQALALSK